MEIIVKKSARHIDPKHPESTDPNWSRAYAKGQESLARGTFKIGDPGEREAYRKALKSNPQNVPGIPAFFPPLRIPPMVVPDASDIGEEERLRRRVIDALYADGELYCKICDSMQTFALSPVSSFCKKCGTTYNFLTRRAS